MPNFAQSIKNEIISLPAVIVDSVSPSQHISTLNMPPLPSFSLVSTPSPSNAENNNVNLVIDVPVDNDQPNITVAAADNSSTHSESPSNVGNM